MSTLFYSNGKLLLSGEYVVLDGAKSLGVPTSFGQSLSVATSHKKCILWKSYTSESNLWIDIELTWDTNLVFASTDNTTETQVLLKAFNWIAHQKPTLFFSHGYVFENRLTFPNNWGLGSSSTFVNNLASWSNTDAYQLQELLFGGSGYDVACAKHATPILFQRKATNHFVEEVNFAPSFSEELFFVHLNQKKNSREAIKHYRAQTSSFIADAVFRINAITQQMLQAKDIFVFENLMRNHEKIIGTLLQTPPIQQQKFPDYSRQIKSLGGWGGDFILATGKHKEKDYFKEKGFHTIVDYSEMVLGAQ